MSENILSYLNNIDLIFTIFLTQINPLLQYIYHNIRIKHPWTCLMFSQVISKITTATTQMESKPYQTATPIATTTKQKQKG